MVTLPSLTCFYKYYLRSHHPPLHKSHPTHYPLHTTHSSFIFLQGYYSFYLSYPHHFCFKESIPLDSRMSCNGCRVLRKGCSDSCILRPCLQWIDTAEAQAHATLFVAKFFGRADLMSFISAVPTFQRPALFQSLLFEACGRTVNPVNGAVGLLSTGNWHICQAAVDTVLHGGTLRPSQPEFLRCGLNAPPPYGHQLKPKTYMQEEQGMNTTSFESELSDNVTGNNWFESSGENDGDALVGQNMKLLNLFV